MRSIGDFLPPCGNNSPRRWIAVLATIALSLPASAWAAPRTSVTAIEAEVMCPVCGTLLELAESPQAKREKVYVAKLVAAGKTEAEVKDALVAQYGPEVMALPKASGFDLSAYLVPVIAVLVAVAAIAFSLRRWRREAVRAGEGSASASPPHGSDAERLEADLSRYDL